MILALKYRYIVGMEDNKTYISMFLWHFCLYTVQKLLSITACCNICAMHAIR